MVNACFHCILKTSLLGTKKLLNEEGEGEKIWVTLKGSRNAKKSNGGLYTKMR